MTASGVRTSRMVALAAGVGAFFTLQLVAQAFAMGRAPDFVRDLLQELWYWCTWVALTPLIVAIARRWPWETSARGATLARHVAIAAALAPMQTLIAFTGYYGTLQLLHAGLPVALPVWYRMRLGLLVWGAFEGVLFYALILGVATVARLRQLYASEQLATATLESRLARAQLDALRSQLRPHFLFNTLNAISVLTTEDAAKARSMLLRLSSLLRRSLDEEEHEVTLQQELAFLDEYLEIQIARFGDRLRVTREVDPKTLPSRVPVFLLQPLVENAIVHGAAERDGVTEITVRAACVARALQLTVCDNGPSLERLPEHDGIGLRNTRERLTQLYGDGASLTLRPAGAGDPHHGACVEIVVPAAAGSPCAS